MTLNQAPQNLLLRGARGISPGSLQHVVFDSGQTLWEVGGESPFAFFPLRGVVSLQVTPSAGKRVEVAMVGREGFAGLALTPRAEQARFAAVALSGGDVIGVADIGLPSAAFSPTDSVFGAVDSTFGASDLVDLGVLATPEEVAPPPVAQPEASTAPAALPSDLVAYLDAVERDILIRALERYRFNRTAAGASLGLSLRQMRYRMARLGVNVADHVGERESG